MNGTVVPEPTPVSNSPHPYTVMQAPVRVYPLPTVNVDVEDADSALPMTMELEAGVNEPTETLVDPADEPPVDVDGPVVVIPVSS